jgi:hypothetical protein
MPVRSESNATLLALKGLFAAVDSGVCFQVSFFGETLRTNVTFKRFDSLMGPYVNFKSTCSGVGILA